MAWDGFKLTESRAAFYSITAYANNAILKENYSRKTPTVIPSLLCTQLSSSHHLTSLFTSFFPALLLFLSSWVIQKQFPPTSDHLAHNCAGWRAKDRLCSGLAAKGPLKLGGILPF